MPVLNKLNPILASPQLYLAYNFIVGGIAARKKCIRSYIPPTSGLTVLDIGCGPGYTITCFTDPVYYGFDIAPDYIAWARRKFAAHGNFYCQYFDEDALTWVPPVDVVLMMGVLHHMDNTAALDLLRLIRRTMKPGGVLLTLDGCYRPGQSRIAKFFLDEDRGRFIRDAAGYEDMARKVFKSVEIAVRDDLFLIPYTTMTLQCRD
jgi:SAM-dependent methyltransferase